MILEKERQEIVYYLNQLISTGLTKGTGGNISAFNRERNLIAISPSGMDYATLEAKDIVVTDLEGNIVDGDHKPSSEWSMHAIFYQRRSDLNAMVHTHSPFAKTIATMRKELPAISYLVAYAGKNVRCSEYASFGTKQLAENAFEGMRDRKAVLLANHGLLAGAHDLANAFNITEEIEFCCEIYYRSLCIGTPYVLDDEEMSLMDQKFQSYGQR